MFQEGKGPTTYSLGFYKFQMIYEEFFYKTSTNSNINCHMIL